MTPTAGSEQATNEVVDLGDRPGHFQPGAKVMTFLHALIAGAECIDGADVVQ